MDIKILSWNIWIDCDFGKLTEFLSHTDADIIGLQEVKADDPGRDVIGFMKQHGYAHVFAETKQEWGGAIYRHGPALFTKLPVVHRETHLLDTHDERAVARADIQVNGTVLHVFSTHLVHTHQQPSIAQAQQVKNLLQLLPQEHTIVMGDFNATPESDTVARMTDMLVHTDPTNTPTWSVHPAGCTVCNPHTVDTRLDYIFATRDIEVVDSQVEQSYASDHLPITAVVHV